MEQHAIDYDALAARIRTSEIARINTLIANTEAVNKATGRLALLCATSRNALRLNAGLQRSFKHDALVAAGVFPAKLTGRQMDRV